MVCFPRYYNGLFFSMEQWFVFFGGVMVCVRLCNGLCPVV